MIVSLQQAEAIISEYVAWDATHGTCRVHDHNGNVVTLDFSPTQTITVIRMSEKLGMSEIHGPWS